MERHFELETHRLAYRLQEQPGKERILLLHGLGTSLRQYDQELPVFAKDYAVASLSLRGQGHSTRPAGSKPEDMTIAALAADVVRWLQAHQWETAHVVACSMGGVVALEVLQSHPHLFKSLITFGTTPKLEFSRAVIAAGAWLSDLILPGLFPHWMAKTLPKTTTDKPDAQRRFAEDLRIAYGQRSTIYQLRCHLASYDYTQVLKESTIPILLLQGEKDSGINKEIEKLWPLLKDNPLVQREVLQDAGHIANYDQPQAFCDSVIRFIEENAA